MENDAASRRELKINCLDYGRRVLLRFLALSCPLWALLMPSCLLMKIGKACYFNSAPITDPYLLLGYASIVCTPLGLALTAGLLRKNLLISDTKLTFPGFQIAPFACKKLKYVELRGKRLEFFFSGRRRKAVLNLNRISQQDRLKLASCLQDRFPSAVFPAECLEQIESFDEPELDPLGSLELDYDSHFKTREFLSILSGHEKKIWLFWGGLWSVLGIFDAQLLWNLFSGKDLTLSLLARLLFELFNHMGEGCVSLIQGNDIFSWLLVFLALLIFFLLFKSLGKANRMKIDRNGIELSHVIGEFRIRKSAMKWSDCASIELERVHQRKKISNCLIYFKGRDPKQLLKISTAALSKPEYQALIKQAASLWAPHVELDAAFLESAEPEQRQTYTELWLQSLSSPPKRDRLAPLSPGDYLQSGSYRVLELVGAGGQGIAYLAECLDRAKSESRTVVIKEFVLPVYVNRKARQAAIEKFEKESTLLGSMKNDHIVGLHDHFVEDHRAYLVLEHVKGRSLRKTVEESGPLSEERLDKLFPQLCSILEYLHGLSPPLVHRDFTPDNLILDESGKLKLIDFNVARQNSDNKSSVVVGRHAYMPPEQFAGRAVPQSDLYALGATLYFLLCAEDPTPFSQSGKPLGRSECSRVWEEIIASCTALDLKERVAGASDLMAIFQSYKEAPATIKLGEEEKAAVNEK